MSFLVFTLTMMLAGSDEPEPVAMVLNVQGDVKVRRMDLLRSGDLVRVPASGNVRLVFLADGHRETLSMAGTVTITKSGGTPAGAVKREKAKLPASQLAGLRTLAASARAGVSRVRGADAPPPLSPIAGSTILGDRPPFAWSVVPGVDQYDVQLFRGDTDRKENLVWSVRSAKNHLDYPKDQPALDRDETYTWKVSAREKGVVAKGSFTVATNDQASDFESIRKLSRSPEASDRLLAAMLFEEAQVYDESHRLFEELAKQLPAEPWVLLASARHLARLGNTEEATRREKKALRLAGKSP